MITVCASDTLLQSICKPDGRKPVIRNPWVIECSKGRFAAATDDVRALYLEITGGDPYPRDPLVTSRFVGLLEEATEPTHQIDRDDLIAAIGPGDLLPEAPDPDDQACDRCNGYGEIECDLRHWHDCPGCNGDRRKRQQLWVGEPDPLLIGGMPALIDARLARGVFEHIPGTPILLSSLPRPKPGAICFRGPGWVFVVACLYRRGFIGCRAVATQPARCGLSAEAPRDVPVHREEVYQRIRAEMEGRPTPPGLTSQYQRLRPEPE